MFKAKRRPVTRTKILNEGEAAHSDNNITELNAARVAEKTAGARPGKGADGKPPVFM